MATVARESNQVVTITRRDNVVTLETVEGGLDVCLKMVEGGGPQSRALPPLWPRDLEKLLLDTSDDMA
jgi:hypothetical protein